MRGPISDVPVVPFSTAAPVRTAVPGMLLDDPVFCVVCAAVDDLLAPSVAAVDCFPAYLDPWLAPDDFVDWLTALVGVPDGLGDRRAAVATAAAGYGSRGTAAAVRLGAAAAAGVSAESVTVDDPGGVTWSPTPCGVSAVPPPTACVRIVVPGGDAAAIAADVQAALEPGWPVHCPLKIEVVTT